MMVIVRRSELPTLTLIALIAIVAAFAPTGIAAVNAAAALVAGFLLGRAFRLRMERRK